MTSLAEGKKRKFSLSPVGSSLVEVKCEAAVEVKSEATVEDFVPAPPDESNLSPIHEILQIDLWSNDSTMVTSGFIKLEQMCASSNNTCSEKRASIHEAGGHLAIVVALKKWYADPEIQFRGLRALAVCGLGSNLFWDRAREAGALDLVAAAMKNYPNNLSLQETGCLVFYGASFYKENAERIVKVVGGSGAIIEAMKTFQFSANLQWYACSTLDLLSDWDEFKVPIVDDGALVGLSTAIETFRDDNNSDTAKRMVQRARAALKRLVLFCC